MPTSNSARRVCGNAIRITAPSVPTIENAGAGTKYGSDAGIR